VRKAYTSRSITGHLSPRNMSSRSFSRCRGTEEITWALAQMPVVGHFFCFVGCRFLHCGLQGTQDGRRIRERDKTAHPSKCERTKGPSRRGCTAGTNSRGIGKGIQFDAVRNFEIASGKKLFGRRKADKTGRIRREREGSGLWALRENRCSPQFGRLHKVFG